MSAIYILWLREVKRYLRSRAQIVASLGQPMLYLLVLGFGLGPVFRRAGNGDYLQFIAPGVIGMTVLFSSIFSGLGLLWDRQFGFLKETLVSPVPRIQIMIGRTMGGATVAVMQGLLVTIICLVAGFRPAHISTIPVALGFMILIALLFAAATNLFSYWNSDKLVLSMHDAQEVDERSAPELIAIVRELAQRASRCHAST